MGITQDDRQAAGLEAHLWEQHCSEGLLDSNMITNILKLANCQWKLLELLYKQANTCMLWKYIPFMSHSWSLAHVDRTRNSMKRG